MTRMRPARLGAARLDWQSALKLAGLNDRYPDLLARTAADDQAIAGITTLTGQASAADQTMRESLRRATRQWLWGRREPISDRGWLVNRSRLVCPGQGTGHVRDLSSSRGVRKRGL
jgi:hypothetical protein